jgi:glycine cleavage system H protein
MDGFTYSDIFATKGLEYLIIIAFLAMLIPFALILNKQVKMTRKLQNAVGNLTAAILKVPQGLFFSRNHTWMFMERNGVAKVGLDDLLLHLTGEVEIYSLRTPGEMIHKGDLMTEVKQDGKLLKIFSPVSGKVTDTNTALTRQPALLNDDPYGRGWIYKIKPSNWIADAKSCYIAEEATTWSATELARFRDFMARTMKDQSQDASMVILQDGGELMDHTLSAVPADIWKEFQHEFLTLYRL